jgi:iron complex transport system substrate-binding protein
VKTQCTPSACSRVLARIGLVLALLSLVVSAPALAEIHLTDAAGRTVRLDAPAKRIVTNESLLLLSLALIDPDPVSRIAGWANPQRIDPGMFAAFRAKFPAIDAIPTVGALQPAQASVESILSAKPDLLVIHQWQPGWQETVDLLASAAVPVIFLDGPVNDQRLPQDATAFSIELLGKAIGRDGPAADYAKFVRDRYAAIIGGLKNTSERPKVLVDGFASSDCCSTPGRDNRMTQNIALAGGVSIGANAVPGYEGRLNPEYILQADPAVYIATGVPQISSQTSLVIGGGVAKDLAHRTLRQIVDKTVRRDLKAVARKRVHGISHQMSISALNVVIFECFAKWIHPELFAEIDPDKTLAEINRRFLAVKLEGTFFTSLSDAP